MALKNAIPIIGSVADTASGIIGQHMSNKANKELAYEQREWNTAMAREQRSFDLEMWNRANEYNSPQMQMARFKEAGLNPHLIYGKGTAGNATPMRSPDVKPYSRAEAKNVLEGANAFGDFQRFKNLEAQTDNVKTNSALQKAETANKVIEGLVKTKNWELIKEFSHDYAEAFKGDLAKRKFDGYKAETDSEISEAQADNIADNIKADLKLKESQVKKMDAETALKEIDKKLWEEERIRPADPYYLRIVSDILTSFGLNIKDILNPLKF